MSLLMIHEAYMPVYIGSGFLLRRTGPPEVVQEALADLKSHIVWKKCALAGRFFSQLSDYRKGGVCYEAARGLWNAHNKDINMGSHV